MSAAWWLHEDSFVYIPAILRRAGHKEERT
jgi:hypothetical protein